MMKEAPPEVVRAWFASREPGRLVGRGHLAGDFLEAYEWHVLEERAGHLRLDVHLPPQVRNARGQLFGGFTPTYVEFVALFTVHAGMRSWEGWLATTNMRVDYFEPIVGPRFTIESDVLKRRGRLRVVETRFFDPPGTLAVFALTTARHVPPASKSGDE